MLSNLRSQLTSGPVEGRSVEPLEQKRILVLFACIWASITAIYGLHLVQLVRFAADSSLYSHILLIPGVSIYFIWFLRDRLPRPQPGSWAATSALAAASALLAGSVLLPDTPLAGLPTEDRLCWLTLSYLLAGFAGTLRILGREFVRTAAFPLGFLIFMAPMPLFMEHAVESILQHGSAAVVHLLFVTTQLPFVRDGLTFQIPGITLNVAPECSGIHSSLVLFVTSVVAGQLFLKSPWKRILLAAAVLPVALFRNGFRILVIAELCARIGPEMINSYIHKRGGWIFFGLSLVPFFLLLWLLRRSDARAARREPSG